MGGLILTYQLVCATQVSITHVVLYIVVKYYIGVSGGRAGRAAALPIISDVRHVY